MAAAGFPSNKVTAATVEVWCRVLADIPKALVEAAVLDYISGPNEFFPSPGQVRQRAIELGMPQNQLSPPEAWGEILMLMRKTGFYGEPLYSCPAVEKAVECVGGWKYLCSSENMVADRARFLQAYETMQKRQADEQTMLPEVRELARLGVGQMKRLTGGRDEKSKARE